MSIVLVGFMGAGKSVVGEALAALTGLRLVDTDRLVEASAGASIPEIFDHEGERAFRAREAAAVAQAVAEPDRVIACGGGAVLQPHNYEALRSAGPIVYLRAPAGTLRARLEGTSSRPLLAEPGALERLLAERAPAYEAAADVVVDTAGRNPEDVASEIVERLGALRA